MQVKIVGPVPEYKTKGAAGADLKAVTDTAITVHPGEIRVIPTGIRMAIPDGYEAQVRPRSGLAAKNSMMAVLGTIDSDYRGEMGVIMVNLGKEDFVVNNGDRVAQAVFAKVERVEFIPVDSLDDTERGEGGFGSTGVAGENN